MHYSNDENNFRNKQYLKSMDKEFKRMFRAYHKLIAYKNKLENELTLSVEDKKELDRIKSKFKRNVCLANKRVHKDDFIVSNDPTNEEQTFIEKNEGLKK